MKKSNEEEIRSFIYEVLCEEYNLLSERTEQDWEDSGDPNAEELDMLDQAKEYLIKIWN